MSSSTCVLTSWHSTSKLGRRRIFFNLNTLKISDDIPSRSLTIKAASTVMKERMSKDADFLVQHRKWFQRPELVAVSRLREVGVTGTTNVLKETVFHHKF